MVLTLDGKPVDAQYDPHARAVKYTPNKPMTPGAHNVDCRITFEGGASFDKKWVTRIAEAPLAEFPSPTRDQVEAITAINDLRHALGLTTVVPDQRLNIAAFLHSSYLAKNNENGHAEKPGTPGFLGASGVERLEAYGYVGSCWEDVGFGSHSVTEAVNDLFDAPYHRIPFLQPGSIPFGSGYVDQRTTLEFGASDEGGVVVSPADGQTRVPCLWHNFERPNPLRSRATTTTVTGYPIVLAGFGTGFSRLHGVSARLAGPKGEPITCWLNKPENDDVLTSAAILIPQLPLRAKSTYTATFSAYDDEDRPIDKTVKFTTGARN
ncbi:putative S-layer associated protein [Fimbriimonas ginsengisoli Gsoil 348]|uniref:Putative S-layer associated protein n=1 Tax=Fimbriimonas ginsengisoli Gsoil 348 TaxID=661478 RepID=A0A068NWQ4_FIMGI|nr:putative S-layer associated protein [Fimbriimonas ginsengisoli Gsoil 348]